MLRVIFIALLVLWCFFELTAFGWLAEHTGLLGCLFQILLTMILGAKIVANQPKEMLRSVQTRLAAGENPQALLSGGIRIIFAGAFFIVPGLVTDAIGCWLWIGSRLKARSSSYDSPWTENEGAQSQQNFDQAWQGDEFEQKMKQRSKDTQESDIADATIISTQEDNEPKS